MFLIMFLKLLKISIVFLFSIVFLLVCTECFFLFLENKELKGEVLSLHEEIRVLKASAVGSEPSIGMLGLVFFIASLLLTPAPADFLLDFTSTLASLLTSAAFLKLCGLAYHPNRIDLPLKELDESLEKVTSDDISSSSVDPLTISAAVEIVTKIVESSS
jgi:hypothetical protein